MKTNLKNFPSHVEKGDCPTCEDYCKWKDAFKRELSEKLVYGEKAEKAWRGAKKHRVDEEIAMEWQGANRQIKEILGDETAKCLK